MATNVNEITVSLEKYQEMMENGRESLEKLLTTLIRIQDNLNTILIVTAIFFTLFFLWLIGVQIIVLIKGWEMMKEAETSSQ